MPGNSLHNQVAVFLDRDGTIIEDADYCSRTEDVRILPAVLEAMRLLRFHGFKMAVVSNQSGVGRGYFTETEVEEVNRYIMEKLERCNAGIDGMYYCPHHPDENCSCRKPKPGMILRASEEIGVDLGGSFMVGDKASDIETGKAAGCRTVLVTTGPARVEPTDIESDFIAGNLLEAARWIISVSSPAARG